MTYFTSSQGYLDFACMARSSWRYIRTPEMNKFLDGVRRTAKTRIRIVPKGWRFWRAQLGHSERSVEQGGEMFHMPTAFGQSRMKPLTGRAREGRVNARGIPCLYGSTSRSTAMAEVRPWMGALVSVALFETTQDVSVVDCSKFHAKSPLMLILERPVDHIPSPQEIEEAVWVHIDNAFSEPVTDSEDLADYAPTQILAELFKSEGYAGIAYKSRLTEDGYNVASFDPGIARIRKVRLYRVTTVQFTFGENPEDEYFVNDDTGTSVRAMVTNVRPAESNADNPC